MCESSLLFQELLDRQFFLRLICQVPYSFYYFIHRPYTSIYRKSAYLSHVLRLVSPASRTRRQNIQETWSLRIYGFIGFFMEILKIADKRSLCSVRYIVSGYYFRKVFLVLYFPRYALSAGDVVASANLGVEEDRCIPVFIYASLS